MPLINKLVGVLVLSVVFNFKFGQGSHSEESSKKTTNWSVELSQVTTLAPPSKTPVVDQEPASNQLTNPINNNNNNHLTQHQRSQDIVFDDAREPMHLMYAPALNGPPPTAAGGSSAAMEFYLKNNQPLREPLINNYNNLTNDWIPRPIPRPQWKTRFSLDSLADDSLNSISSDAHKYGHLHETQPIMEVNHKLNNANQRGWSTNHYQPPPTARPSASYMTWAGLNRYLNQNEPIGALPSNLIVPKDLLQRAMSIQERLLRDQSAAVEQQLSMSLASSSSSSSLPKKLIKNMKLFSGGQPNNQSMKDAAKQRGKPTPTTFLSKPASNKRASKVRDETGLMDGEPYDYDESLEARTGSASNRIFTEHLGLSAGGAGGPKDLLRDVSMGHGLPGLVYLNSGSRSSVVMESPSEQQSQGYHLHHQQPSIIDPNKARLNARTANSVAVEAMTPADSHHHLTPLVYSYHGHQTPAAYIGHKQVSARNEKGLVTPILVGVVAALISFLIISNLFLSIPLFAITLWQLLSGNMMMLPNGSNNQNGFIPPNQNQNGGGQQTNGRRRRRRDLTSNSEPLSPIFDADLGSWILDCIEEYATRFENINHH